MPTAVESIVDQISGMTALELSSLKKALEEKFGVTAAAPAFPAGFGGFAPASAAAAPVEEEQTEFDVILTNAGGTKLQVIRVVRELTGLGLKEAKDLVDSAPKPIKQAVTRDEADKIKASIAEAGGEVEIK
jgi:large subunit ribosomal protein L7/L12